VVEVASLVLVHRRRKIFERTLYFLHSLPPVKTILCFFLGQNGAIYTHFLRSPLQTKKHFFGGGQNGTIYTFFAQPAAGEKIRGFFGSKWWHIYTFWVFLLGVKIVPYINIFYFLERSKCCHIYTFLGFLGVNMLPYVHILGIFWVKMLPYIHISRIQFFPKKRKKQKTIDLVGIKKGNFCSVEKKKKVGGRRSVGEKLVGRKIYSEVGEVGG
jgi:hypothetical protein